MLMLFNGREISHILFTYYQVQYIMDYILESWFEIVKKDLDMIAGQVEDGDLNQAQSCIENAKKNLEWLKHLVESKK